MIYIRQATYSENKMLRTKSIWLLTLSLLLILGCMPSFPLTVTPTPVVLNINGVTQLASSVAPGFTSLVWSPDSTRLAVTYVESLPTDDADPVDGRKIQVQILTIDNQEITNIDEAGSGVQGVLAWLPDDRIAYYVDQDLQEGTWVIPANGNGTKEIIVPGIQAFFSMDGKQIAYWNTDLQMQPNRLSVWVQNFESGEKLEYFRYEEQYLIPGELKWSPDGSQILFTFGTTFTFSDQPLTYDQAFKNFDLWNVDIHSWYFERITKDGFHYSVTWSPDQKLIAYSYQVKSDQYDGNALYLNKSDSSCPVQILPPGDYGLKSLNWSPNGRWIAFIWDQRIYLLDTVEILGKDLVKYYSACP